MTTLFFWTGVIAWVLIGVALTAFLALVALNAVDATRFAFRI